MRVRDVYAHFHGSQSAIARVLGCGRATVNEWQGLKSGLVPEICAFRLRHLSGGALDFDPAVYDRAEGRREMVPYREVMASLDGTHVRTVYGKADKKATKLPPRSRKRSNGSIRGTAAQ